MKCTVIIDDSREEETVIYAHSYSQKVKEIENCALDCYTELIGYSENGSFCPISPTDVYCFLVDDGRVFAMLKDEKLRLKERLYTLEDSLGDRFIKINQSCIANISKIEKFEASFGGAIRVVFKNGHTDFISRRQLKSVKNRLGI